MAKRSVRSLISLIQNRFFTTSTTLPAPPPPSSAAQSSRFAWESAMSITKRKAAFSNLLKDYGFKDPQIQKLSECSRVLQLDAKGNLKPKLDCFVENGFTGEILHKLIVSSPYILHRGLDSCIKPKFQVLKQYLDSDDKVVSVIKRSTWIFGARFKLNFIPNIEFLINEGVPVNRVSHLLLLQPRVLLQSRVRMACAFKTVRESGVAPDDPMFIRSLRVVCAMSESTLKKKLEIFKSFGWSEEQAFSIIKRRPTCLSLSEEHLRKKIGFYLNTVKLEAEMVIRSPILLAYSEERIRARYEVLKILKSKELIRDYCISTAINISDDQFLNDYVFKHLERLPGLLDMYHGIVKEVRNNKQGKKTGT